MKKYYPSPARVKPTLTTDTYSFYRNPLWMDADGTVIYSMGKQLGKSSDLMKTNFQLIHDFGDGFHILNGVRMDNGKIFLTLGQTTTDKLFWYVVDPTKTPATATLVKETPLSWGSPTEGRFRLIDTFGQIVIVGTYANLPGTNTQRIYLSRDYGTTWKTIWDVPVGVIANQQHVHSVGYDKYRNYIWAALGDHDNASVIYSTNMGATWNHVYKQVRTQFINIYPMADRLIADTDVSPDGVYMIPMSANSSKPVPLPQKATISTNEHENNFVEFRSYAMRGIADDSSYPWNVLLPFGGQESGKIGNPLIMTYDGIHAFNIHEMPYGTEGAAFTKYIGDFHFEYLIGITPENFMLNGQPYGKRAFGRGKYWDGAKWVYTVAEFEVPKWIAIE